jgi:glycosyltransferase involved in cell wall biosynthesis
MRILMVISQFHPIIGGAEKQAQSLAKRLIKKGVEVNIVTGWWNLRTPRKEMIDGVKVFRNFSCWGMLGTTIHRTIRILRGFVYILSLGFYLLVHWREYDVIHVHQALYPAFVSVWVGKGILNKPVIVKTASSGITSDIHQMKRFPMGDLQLRYLLQKMDYLVAVSRAAGDEFRDIGYPSPRIVSIPNGVEIPDEEKIIQDSVQRTIAIARFSIEKGIDVLIRAWVNVVQTQATLKLVLLGDGPEAKELRNLANSLAISHSIEFAGMVRYVEEYLRNADLFILPSRAEGLSNALLEAMSYGIPCIATHVGGTAELLGMNHDMKILPGGYLIARNGVVVNPDDVKGLSEGILYLIRNKNAREEIGRRGRIFVKENYSIDLVAQKYIGLYRRVLKTKR